MSKNKQQKFTEMAQFKNVLQPPIKGLLTKDYKYKGKWNEEIFKNSNPIVLEIGCGKGEYSVGLAQKYPNKNFLGIDIKGARIWKGAKRAIELNLKNVFFLRTKIDFLVRFFENEEISEIWIPHPDPQPKKPKKRLSSAHFLSIYQNIIKNNALIHLKTDSHLLHYYTLDMLKANNIETIEEYNDIYDANLENEITQIQTFYEQMFLKESSKITYLNFRLNKTLRLINPPTKEIVEYKY
ncbi:MAG: tRNA (guanosine(46)-N7)-methyltransferase TrmB [Bacteroidota bacterium]|nr:tRNA (guanosine(46)-N7)-methyltransferase TrmB [Bacteroidota bacterium]